MTATFAHSSWPALHAPARRGTWRFGQEIAVSAEPGAAHALQWLLRRNCSITPRQLLAAYAALCALSLSVALGFALNGAPVVMAFSGVELVLVGLAMLAFARHAGDREMLTLVGRSLLVEQTVGSHTQRAAFSADWLTVEPAAGQNSLVVLGGQGRSVRVGRFLRPELRAEFARELRLALRQAPAAPQPIPSFPQR